MFGLVARASPFLASTIKYAYARHRDSYLWFRILPLLRRLLPSLLTHITPPLRRAGKMEWEVGEGLTLLGPITVSIWGEQHALLGID